MNTGQQPPSKVKHCTRHIFRGCIYFFDAVQRYNKNLPVFLNLGQLRRQSACNTFGATRN